MPPSVRVRRNRTYPNLPDADDVQSLTSPTDTQPASPVSPTQAERPALNVNPAASGPSQDLRRTTSRRKGRARSRTIASIFEGGQSLIDRQPPSLSRPSTRGAQAAGQLPSTSYLPNGGLSRSPQPAPYPMDTLPPPVSSSPPHLGGLGPRDASHRSMSILEEGAPGPFRTRSMSAATAGSERPTIDLVLPPEEHSRTGAAIHATSSRDQMSIHDPALRDPELREEQEEEEEEHHHDDVVDHLDVIDPGVATISYLANAANCILIPPILTSTRNPVVDLPTIGRSESQTQLVDAEAAKSGTLVDELDLHVEHILTKRQRARRALRGLWAFLKTPMGVFAAVYGVLVAFWGAAIVLFLLHWINLHNDYWQREWIEISSQIVNGLFTITGVGLIPWRSMDTYRIVRIAHYKYVSRRIRRKKGLPRLPNENDLPDSDPTHEEEQELLTYKQRQDLIYQQEKFMKSQTWYRPHETDTHRAFPISWALWICLLIDGNSLFQCILCGTMWGLNRYTRPAWSTGTLIPASFLCGIGAVVLIWKGGQRTKKTKEVEKKMRNALNLPPAEGDESPKSQSPDGAQIQEKTPQPSIAPTADKAAADVDLERGLGDGVQADGRELDQERTRHDHDHDD